MNKEVHPVQGSLLPSHSKTSKRHFRASGNRREEVLRNRPSTPESIASEIRRAQEMVDTIPVDPYTQWYQVMQDYYKQFYPGYDFGNKSQAPRQQQRHVPKSAVLLTHHPAQSTAQPPQGTLPVFAGMPGWPGLPQSRTAHNQSVPQMPDYAAYYYQYYFGAMAAAGGWPVPAGRTTPKVFIEPHIRATLSTPGLLIQVLPNRPQEGEPGRVELLDVCQLAADVVAEVSSRLADISHSTSKLHRSTAVFPPPLHGSSEGQASTLSDNEEADGDEEYIALITAWDRTDHTFYPGPLCHGTTLKHDVQAFLRGRVEDIDDHILTDWDSAGLLLSYLELLVKNNGIAQAGDVINLLLEDDNPMAYDYTTAATTSASPFFNDRSSTLPALHRQSSFRGNYLYNSTTVPTDDLYARGSPRTLTHSASTASSTSGASISKLLRKGVLAGASSVQERDTASLNRYRELLLHGHPLKALDQACQQQLWGHAFALAHRMGPAALERVMERFLVKAVDPADPLITLYQLTAGEMPRYVNQLACATVADARDWRRHVAMLLSAPEGHEGLTREALEHVGQSLLTHHLLFAAHLCFLLAAASATSASSAPHFPHSVWLLGVEAPKTTEVQNRFAMTTAVERAPTEAIQLTEVYEYALALATRDKHFFLPQFLPFKFAYCLRLLDAGLVEKAFRYLMVLSHALVTLLEQPDSDLSPAEIRSLFLMISQCLRLSEQLQCHPEVGSFESGDILGGGSSRRSAVNLDWLERLREVYLRMCGVLGLATEYHPYSDSLRRPQEDGEGQEPPEDPSAMHPPAASTPFQARQDRPPSTRPPQQPEHQHHHVHHQNPQASVTNYQSSTPVHITSTSQAHETPGTEPASHPSITGAPHHHSEASHPSRRPSHASVKDVVVSRPAEVPPPSHASSSTHQAESTTSSSSSAIEPGHASAVSQPPFSAPRDPQPATNSVNYDFFVPAVSGDRANPDASSDPPPYDYFAGLSMTQHAASRSRTVSVASSHESSSLATSASPSLAGGGGGGAHPANAAFRPRQPSTSESTLRDSRSRNTGRASLPGEAPPSHAQHPPPVFTTAPPQPPVSKPRPTKTHREPQPEPEQAQSDEAKANATGKSGWFSGLFGRRKGGQEVYLPDDSNPSIVWDEAAGCWRDLRSTESEDATPPPPPMMMPTMSSPAVAPPGPPQPLGGGASGSRRTTTTATSARSRYVNVLANQTAGAEKLGAPALQPPLPIPPTLMPPSS
uniref:Sec16_C domain-containing protein n=1 Tax=Mesocestoides corti TaxID=53468 RepID=A0A5K3F5U8_MESCO